MSTATVVLAVDSRQAEASLQRFKQGSEQAAAAVKPLENPILAKFDSAQAVAGMKTLSVEAQGTYETLMKITQAAAAIFAGSKLVGFFSSSVKEAASHREDVAQFQHIFRNVRNEADAMVKTLQGDMFGRTSREAMQLTMNLGSMLKGIGLTDQAAVGLSGEFAKMAVDIGSFMAKDPTAVMDAFQSALMGNTMALRTYGVFLTDAQLKEKMALQAKEGLVFATEREAKAYALLSEVQRQQADAIGDHAAESDNYRNQVKTLSNSLGELKVSIGEAFIEPANEVVKSMNWVVDWMKTLDQETVTFIARSAALAGGLATARMAYRTLSPLVATLIGKTVANTTAIGAETMAVNANTAAWAANSTAKKAGAFSKFSTMAIPGTSTASVVGQNTLNAVGTTAQKTSMLSRVGTATGIASVPDMFGLSGSAAIGTGVAGTGAATVAGAAGIVGLGAAALGGGYLVGKYGGRAIGAIGDMNYDSGEGKLGFIERKVTKFTEWMYGNKSDGVDEYVTKFRERHEAQEKLWREQAEAEEKRVAQLKRWEENAKKLKDFELFQKDLDKDFNRSTMSPERLKERLEIDQMNLTEERNRAVDLGDFDKAKELEKDLDKLRRELFSIDTGIMRDDFQKERGEYGKFSDHEKYAFAQDKIDELTQQIKDPKLTDKEKEIRQSQLDFYQGDQLATKDRISQRAKEADEMAFNAQLGVSSRSEQETMLRERLQETEARNDKRLASVKEGKSLTDDDYKLATDDLQKSKDYIEQIKQLQSEPPKIPMFQQTAAEAVDSRSTTARMRESTIWGAGQSKTEKDIGEIRQLMKKLSETAKAIKNKSTVTMQVAKLSDFGY